MRVCNTCHEIKPLDAFHRSPTGLEGRGNKCAKCCSEYQRAWKERQRADAAAAGTAVAAAPRVRGARLTHIARSVEMFDRNRQIQDLAILGAALSKLRKALNTWWEESSEGEETACGPALLAARVALRTAAEEDMKAQRRRRA